MRACPPLTQLEATMAGEYELKIYVVRESKNCHRIGLVHPDGSVEISDQSWKTQKECSEAIEQYAREKGGRMERYQ